MATDGVEIIDGDDAHGNYWGIMNLYDNGASFSEIEKKFPLKPQDWYDDFEKEIYVTSVGLAYWEIGMMTKERLDFIKKIVEKGACVEEWTDSSEEEGEARKTVLEKYLTKISKLDSKPRDKIILKKRTDLIFHENDVLTFQLKNQNYYAIICSKIEQYRGECSYCFVITTLETEHKPNIDSLRDKEIVGHEPSLDLDLNKEVLNQMGLSDVLEILNENDKSSKGTFVLKIEHNDLYHFQDKFEKLGSLNVKENYIKIAAFGYERNFDRFEDIFSDIENYIKVFKYCKYPIKEACQIIE